MSTNASLSLLLLMPLFILSNVSTGLMHKDNLIPKSKHSVKTNKTLCSAKNTAHSHCASVDDNSCKMDTDCPPWTVCDNRKCECRNFKHHRTRSIECDKVTLQLSVLAFHCITFDNETGHIIEGQCIENSENDLVYEYFQLPLNASILNQVICEDRWNRTGRLCGKCLPGHSPLAYSYDMRCVRCPEGNKNIWKFILVALGPLTAFYFIVLFFKVNATSSHLHGYLIFSQIFSTPNFARNVVMYTQAHPKLKIPVQVLIALYTIWNLDFFRDLYPDICLDVSPLTVLALDYTIAVYPLFLTVVSYCLIELHARNFRLVVILWKPFRCLLTLSRMSKTSLIDAYATFFLLSFVKTLCLSSDLLIPVTAHDIDSDNFTWVLYYDATVEYFGSEHLPYAIVAVVFGLVFTIIPTLLLLIYPFKWFQKVVTRMERNQEQKIADAAVPLIGRFILILTYAITLEKSFFPLATSIILIIVIITITIQPYSTQFANYTVTDVTFWGYLSIFYSIVNIMSFSSFKPSSLVEVAQVLRVTVMVFPLVHMFCVSVYWMLSRMRKVKVLVDHVKAWKRGYVEI